MGLGHVRALCRRPRCAPLASLATRRNLTNCFPFSHVREPPGNASMHAGTSARASERESAFGHSYLRTYSPSLSLSLTTFTPSFPPSAARRKAAAGEEVSQPRPVCRSAGRSVDGSWPFICIANYENETERGGGGGEEGEARTTRRERRCAPAFVARCQLHNCAAAADRRSRHGKARQF